MDVEWPWQRDDVLAGLEVLAGEPQHGWGHGGTLLEGAVHAVVDDTFWDQPQVDPARSVGTILRNEREADAVRAVVAAVGRVAARQGATSSDAAWFADREWPLVRRLAAEAAAVFRSDDSE